MGRRGSRRAEIEALAAEMAARRRPPPDPLAEGEAIGEAVARESIDTALDDALALGVAGAEEAVRLLEDLRAQVEEGIEDTRAFTASHPVAAVSAAFLLGLAVARLWRSS